MNPRRMALLAASYLGTFLASLDISIVNVALPTLQKALNTDIAGLQWIINAYAICLSAFMLSAGSLSERFGLKRIWLISISLFTVGSIACAFTDTLSWLLVGRAIQGVAGALLIPSAMPIITHAFPDPKQRASAIGGWSAFSAIALISGPLVGGLLLDNFGWQSIFSINIPIGIIAFALGLYGINEYKPEQAAKLDKLGLVLSVLGLASLTFALIAVGDYGLYHSLTLSSLALAVMTLSLFIYVEKHQANPLLPLALFNNSRFLVANFASFTLGFASYSTLFFFSLYLQQVRGFSASESGLHMLAQFVSTILLSLAFGRLNLRFGLNRLMIVGYVLLSLSLLLMLTFTLSSSSIWICFVFALLGIGMGLNVPGTGLVVMDSAPKPKFSAASATMNSLRQTGMTLGIALLGALLNIQSQSYLQQHAQLTNAKQLALNHGFHVAMLGAALLSIVACIYLSTKYFLRPKVTSELVTC